MANWLAKLFRRRSSRSPADDPQLALERELRSLRLDLMEKEERLSQLQGEVERQRRLQSVMIEQERQASLERVFISLAPPITQLLTQIDLAENQGKPLAADDVLTVVKSLISALQSHGLEVEGKVGERLAFDPDRHAPLAGSGGMQRGYTVELRFAGLSYHGKLLHKAIVSRAGDPVE